MGELSPQNKSSWTAVTLSGFLLIRESEAGDLPVDWGRGRRWDKSMNPQGDGELARERSSEREEGARETGQSELGPTANTISISVLLIIHHHCNFSYQEIGNNLLGRIPPALGFFPPTGEEAMALLLPHRQGSEDYEECEMLG